VQGFASLAAVHFREYWTTTTHPEYLIGYSSRRRFMKWSLPGTIAIALVTDLQNDSGASALLCDCLALVASIVGTRLLPLDTIASDMIIMTLHAAYCIANLSSLDDVSFEIAPTGLNIVMSLQWYLYALGVHTIGVVCWSFLIILYIDMSPGPSEAQALQIPTLLLLALPWMVMIEYAVATLHVQRREKQLATERLLDSNTDGYLTIDCASGAITAYSPMAVDTLAGPLLGKTLTSLMFLHGDALRVEQLCRMACDGACDGSSNLQPFVVSIQCVAPDARRDSTVVMDAILTPYSLARKSMQVALRRIGEARHIGCSPDKTITPSHVAVCAGSEDGDVPCVSTRQADAALSDSDGELSAPSAFTQSCSGLTYSITEYSADGTDISQRRPIQRRAMRTALSLGSSIISDSSAFMTSSSVLSLTHTEASMPSIGKSLPLAPCRDASAQTDNMSLQEACWHRDCLVGRRGDAGSGYRTLPPRLPRRRLLFQPPVSGPSSDGYVSTGQNTGRSLLDEFPFALVRSLGLSLLSIIADSSLPLTRLQDSCCPYHASVGAARTLIRSTFNHPVCALDKHPGVLRCTVCACTIDGSAQQLDAQDICQWEGHRRHDVGDAHMVKGAWHFRDTAGNEQGPFPASVMQWWCDRGLLSRDCLIRAECEKRSHGIGDGSRLFVAASAVAVAAEASTESCYKFSL